MQVSSFQLSRFIHDASFNPTALFPLAFSPISTETTLVDSKGAASAASLSFTNAGDSLASLIETHQPNTYLGTASFLGSDGWCLPCSPNCASCSAYFACTSCYQGALASGICITQTVQAEGGEAASTSFSFSG